MLKSFVLIAIALCSMILSYSYWRHSGNSNLTSNARSSLEVVPNSGVGAEELIDGATLKQAKPLAVSLEQRYPYILEPGSSFVTALRNLDISHQEIHNLVTASRPLQDLGRLNAGTRFQVTYSKAQPETLSTVRIKMSPQVTLLLARTTEGVWQAEKIQKTVTTKIVTFKGIVRSSLWESAVEAKMNPSLISDLAEIFAWQVDFSREVRVGDRWRLSVEEDFVAGESIGWGSILSAEYTNVEATHTAVLFRKNDENLGYFAPDGSSLKRMFLKSPIEYGRISSRFTKKRFHPVLKIARPHNGVDYAAPRGTPIRVVGDGVIEAIGFNGGAGNYIKVRHNSTHATAYKHLSRFAKGMKRGSRIEQGQTIGYVGSTGLSSGPHLHFEFYVNGRYVDPLGTRFPAAAPIPRDQLTKFGEIKRVFLTYLPAWENQSESIH